jgi:hypothetical protein
VARYYFDSFDVAAGRNLARRQTHKHSPEAEYRRKIDGDVQDHSGVRHGSRWAGRRRRKTRGDVASRLRREGTVTDVVRTNLLKLSSNFHAVEDTKQRNERVFETAR